MFEHDPRPSISGPDDRSELIGRRRLLIGLGIAVAVALVALIPAVTRNNGSGTHISAAGVTTTTSEATSTPTDPSIGEPAQPGVAPPSETPTTPPPSVLGTQFTRPTIKGAPPKPNQQKAQPAAAGLSPTQATTTTALVCRNSTNPACGPFRWDPDPGPNQPSSTTVTASPTPRAGQTVNFHVVITDPDADPNGNCNFSWEYGDGKPGIMVTHCDYPSGFDPCGPTRYGPWTPPARKDGRAEFDGIQHVFDTPGTYTVTYKQGYSGCYNPYGSPAEGSVTITVLP